MAVLCYAIDIYIYLYIYICIYIYIYIYIYISYILYHIYMSSTGFCCHQDVIAPSDVIGRWGWLPRFGDE